MLPVPAATSQVLARLGAAFPFAKIDQHTFGLYIEELQDIEPEVLEQAVSRVIRTRERFPTIREIRVVCAEIVLQLPREVEALAQAEARSRWHLGFVDEAEPPPVHPLVKEAARAIGGFRTLRSSTEPGIVRGQFCRYYRELRENAIQEWCAADALTA